MDIRNTSTVFLLTYATHLNIVRYLISKVDCSEEEREFLNTCSVVSVAEVGFDYLSKFRYHLWLPRKSAMPSSLMPESEFRILIKKAVARARYDRMRSRYNLLHKKDSLSRRELKSRRKALRLLKIALDCVDEDDLVRRFYRRYMRLRPPF